MQTQIKHSSSDQKPLSCYLWPSNHIPPKAILFIVHGMMEHAKRYDHLAQFCNQNQIAVASYDLRGHGAFAREQGELGKIHPRTGWSNYINDTQYLLTQIKEDSPNTPIFLLGHSMGSYIAQQTTIENSSLLSGLILSGTSFELPLITKTGSLLAQLLATLTSPKKKSKLIHTLIFGPYNRRFKPASTHSDWLTRDPNIVQAYIDDPLCGQICSNGFFQSFFNGLSTLYKKENMSKMPKDIPIYMLGGKQDPLSQQSKTVHILKKRYQLLGVTEITTQIYNQARHEILNETNRDEVYNDLISWINTHLPEKTTPSES